MPRTLPWLKGAPAASSKSPTPRNSAVNGNSSGHVKRRRVATPDPGDDLDINTTRVSTPERRARLRQGRTPSTSPPPAPPNEEPMREGYAEDDIWMMVEDEFYATAQLFTQHLHHAEYVRLKKLAKEKAAEPRQFNPVSQFGLQHYAKPQGYKKPAPWKKKKRNGFLDSEDEHPGFGDPQLDGLMDSPRKVPAVLRREDVRRGSGDAAAVQDGYMSSTPAREHFGSVKIAPGVSRPTAVQEAQSTSEDSDDLDGPIKARPTAAPLTNSKRVQEVPTTKLTSHMSKSTSGKPRSRPTAVIPKIGIIPEVELDHANKMQELLAKRRARAKEKEAEERRKHNDTTTEIPMFLI